ISQAIEIARKGLRLSAVCCFGDSRFSRVLSCETRSSPEAQPLQDRPRPPGRPNRPGWGGGAPQIALSPPIFTFLPFFAAFFRNSVPVVLWASAALARDGPSDSETGRRLVF